MLNFGRVGQDYLWQDDTCHVTMSGHMAGYTDQSECTTVYALLRTSGWGYMLTPVSKAKWIGLTEE